MNRRELLVSTAGFFSLFTGCIQGSGESDGSASSPKSTETTNTSETPTTAPPATAEQTFVEFDASKHRRQATATVGDRGKLPGGDKPHEVFVWNDAPAARYIGVQVAGTDDEPLFEREYRLKPGAYVAITLLTPDEYTITLRVDGKRRRPVRVSQSFFDCNYSSTRIRVAPDGSIEFTTLSTAKACAPLTTVESTSGSQ